MDGLVDWLVGFGGGGVCLSRPPPRPAPVCVWPFTLLLTFRRTHTHRHLDYLEMNSQAANHDFDSSGEGTNRCVARPGLPMPNVSARFVTHKHTSI